MSNVRFSIAIPAFKSCYLKECLDSVLSQSFTDFEIVIVNDASPEDIDAIVKGYTDPRIKYYKNEKGYGAEHVVGNWNKCLEYANGDYIICMGDDDRLTSTCLEQYVRIIEKYPDLDVYHARFNLIDENSNIHRINYIDKRDEFESTYTLVEKRFGNRFQFIGDNLFRTSVLREKGGFVDMPCAWFSDELSVSMMAGEKGIASTESIAFQYRINNNTISNNSSYSRLKIKAAKQAKDWYIRFIEDNRTFDEEMKTSLKNMLKRRINRVIRANLAYDISFDLFGGWRKWYSDYSAMQLLNSWLYAIRIRVGREWNEKHK